MYVLLVSWNSPEQRFELTVLILHQNEYATYK